MRRQQQASGQGRVERTRPDAQGEAAGAVEGAVDGGENEVEAVTEAGRMGMRRDGMGGMSGMAMRGTGTGTGTFQHFGVAV